MKSCRRLARSTIGEEGPQDRRDLKMVVGFEIRKRNDRLKTAKRNPTLGTNIVGCTYSRRGIPKIVKVAPTGAAR